MPCKCCSSFLPSVSIEITIINAHQMACGSQHHKYSLYQPGLVAGVLGTCYCVDTDPVAYYITKGEPSPSSPTNIY
jgi:hypothetical protein